ncbi:MAG TPA: hypothetical protein VE074_06895 [Jatrophihabitantaceae bacterium]|nr:hypothetical protein [Jatrophihabitantaceae bacterium]
MSEPRHLDAGKSARLRLVTRSGAHRVTRPSTIAKGPQFRVPALALEADFDLNDELDALLAAASRERHPAGRLYPRGQ